MKTSELTGAALDWAVEFALEVVGCLGSPSTNWAQGGPIIEREKIDLCWSPSRGSCLATISVLWPNEFPCGRRCITTHGPTPLIAAMRCYVASKLGDEVEIPKELL